MQQELPSAQSIRASLSKTGAVTILICALMMVASIMARAQSLQVIHYFTGGVDGARPSAGLTMDAAGNFYGTSSKGGIGGAGTVFKLSHQDSGWAFTVLFSFTGGTDGGTPNAGLIFDRAGNLYGTTTAGGESNCGGIYAGGCGTVFELTPPATPCISGSCPWKETVLHTFIGGDDGAFPVLGNLIFDQAGNLYGTTQAGGPPRGGNFGSGTVFKLSRSGSVWTESILYAFTGGSDGGSPDSGLLFDGAGNLYGTTTQGGAPDCSPLSGCGTVFELSPSGSGWTESVLYSFTAGNDGWSPVAGLISDQTGNLYGASAFGGEMGWGAVFQLSPSNGGWTMEILHSLSSGDIQDNLTMDAEGSLYGAAYEGSTVFELTPDGGGGWSYTSLYNFQCNLICLQGSAPVGSVIFDSNGNLFGTTIYGGLGNSHSGLNDNGVVWELTR